MQYITLQMQLLSLSSTFFFLSTKQLFFPLFKSILKNVYTATEEKIPAFCPQKFQYETQQNC